jgi:hypothetical protein
MLEIFQTFSETLTPSKNGIWGFAGMLAGLDGSSGYFAWKGILLDSSKCDKYSQLV